MTYRCSECLTKFDDTMMDDSIRVFQCTICNELCHEECVHRHTWTHLTDNVGPLCIKCFRPLKSRGKDKTYMVSCPLLPKCSYIACRLCVAWHVRKKHFKELYNKYKSYKNFVAEKI